MKDSSNLGKSKDKMIKIHGQLLMSRIPMLFNHSWMKDTGHAKSHLHSDSLKLRRLAPTLRTIFA